MSEANPTKWYALTAEDAAKQLQVDPAKGLSAAEAQQRLQKYGPNELAARKKESGLQAFLRQYKDFMQIILLGAAVLSLVFTRELGTTIVLVVLTVPGRRPSTATSAVNRGSRAAHAGRRATRNHGVGPLIGLSDCGSAEYASANP